MLEQTEIQEIYSGLRALAESTFPKRCRNCGQEYASAAEFIVATQAVRPNCSGLKQSQDDDDNLIVEVFRNCNCGSTLMESFNDRRDLTEEGIKRRRRFEEMLGHLVSRGVAREVAYAELIKLMRGQANELLLLVRTVAGRKTNVDSR